MSNPLGCETSCCPELTVTAIPGLQGQSAFSTTSALFVVPALGANITIAMVNTDWLAVGEIVLVEGAGLFEVINVVSSTSVELQYVNTPNNTSAGNNVASGTLVTPSATGVDGTDGGNSYTTLTAGFTVPAVGANVSVPDGFVHVTSTTFLGVGQIVFISDGTDFGSFQVVSITNSTQFVAEYQGYAGEAVPGAVIGAGGTVSPGGTQLATPLTVALGGTGQATATLARAALGVGGASLSAFGTGTAYQFTNTAALLNFGTTDPSLTITSAGVWLLLATVRVDYTAATFAAVRTGTLKLRRTNNTAADLANGSRSFLTDIITTLTYTLGVISLPPVIYTTTNANDVIEIFGDVSVVPSAGSLDAVQGEIIAIKLFDQTA